MSNNVELNGQNEIERLGRRRRATEIREKYGLSGNILKMLACALMTVDHMGSRLFPEAAVLRVIGRLAFPIFAFFVAEGCRYTKNKLRYLLSFAVLGLICCVGYYIFARIFYSNILITFSFSIVLIYLLQNVKSDLFSSETAVAVKIAKIVGFAVVAVAVCLYASYADVDYGAAGVFVPVITSLFDFRNIKAPAWLARLDCFPVQYVCFAAALGLLSVSGVMPDIQPWCLLALVPMALYSGKRSMRPYENKRVESEVKYSFYVYYPLHLVVIGLISFM